MGQITPSANHSKGPQQAGEMGKQESYKVQQRKVQSLTLGGITSFSSTDWGTEELQSSLEENSSKPWATACPCRKAQQTPGLHWKEHCQQAEGGDSSTPLSPRETKLKCWVQFWPQSNTEIGIQEWIQLRATKVIKWLEYLTDKKLEKLRLSLSSGKEKAQVIFWKGGVKEEPNSSSKSSDWTRGSGRK